MFKAYDNVKKNEIKRGDIYYVNLPEQNGHVQGGLRPILIVQNDTGNKYSPTVIGCPLTTREKKKLPTNRQRLTRPSLNNRSNGVTTKDTHLHFCHLSSNCAFASSSTKSKFCNSGINTNSCCKNVMMSTTLTYSRNM